ncbi:MAG: amidohydrolase family protein [Nitrospirales bacterium]|nr:amidohydrolase family protein [Nitrospirales bacterium]
MGVLNLAARISLAGLLVGLLSITIAVHATALDFEKSSLPSFQKTYAYINGKWFDGEAFKDTTFYVEAGHLTRAQPSSIDEVVDLQGRFVLPPFGEAHTHNIEGPWHLDQTIQTYLKHGVFYVKNLNNIREFSEQIQHKINSPRSIDVAFAHAGITSSKSHPIRLYEEVLRLYRYEPLIGKKKRGWFKDRAYFVIDSRQDLDHTWPKILSGKPDFLKIYVGHGSHRESSTQAVEQQFRRGLHPSLISSVVSRAHEHGLRVSAHVETAEDFRQAVLGGVDEIAHVPGWYIPHVDLAQETVLRKQDADLARQHNVTVVSTTVAGAFPPAGHHTHAQTSSHGHEPHAGTPHQEAHMTRIQRTAQTIQRDNLQLLHRHGVNIAIGSDHAETSLAEALHLQDLGVFHNRTLLKLWCENTADAIFPGRKIGKLQEGYEASFLVLAGDPIRDFQQVRQITLRVKQGVPLSIEPHVHAH